MYADCVYGFIVRAADRRARAPSSARCAGCVPCGDLHRVPRAPGYRVQSIAHLGLSSRPDAGTSHAMQAQGPRLWCGRVVALNTYGFTTQSRTALLFIPYGYALPIPLPGLPTAARSDDTRRRRSYAVTTRGLGVPVRQRVRLYPTTSHSDLSNVNFERDRNTDRDRGAPQPRIARHYHAMSFLRWHIAVRRVPLPGPALKLRGMARHP